RHTRFSRDWSSDVCSSDLQRGLAGVRVGNDGEGAAAARLACKIRHRHSVQWRSRPRVAATSRRSKAVTEASSFTAYSAPAGKAALALASRATPSVWAVIRPWKLPADARLARSNRWKRVSGASWSTAIQ